MKTLFFITLLLFSSLVSYTQMPELVKDINTQIPQNSAHGSLIKINNTLFFNGQNEHGIELWKTDGTTSGAVFKAEMGGCLP